jgi:hypothetical protein
MQEPGLIWTDAGFVAFDQYKALLADADGKMSGPRTVLAGFGAGVTESLLAVTPTESIKTTLYGTLTPSHPVPQSPILTSSPIASTTVNPPSPASAASCTPCP